MKRKKWELKGEAMEKVKNFVYLGNKLQRNGGQKEHVRERMRKAAAIMGQVWDLRKRRFGKDWERRLWLYDKLIWTLLSYGAEIWGWKEREKVERMKERCLRWLLGMKKRTPG